MGGVLNAINILKTRTNSYFSFCLLNNTSYNRRFLSALFNMGLIYGFYPENHKFLKVFLKFDPNGVNLLFGLKLISSGGKKVFSNSGKLIYFSPADSYLLSTAVGLKTSTKIDFKRFKVANGGKVLLKI